MKPAVLQRSLMHDRRSPMGACGIYFLITPLTKPYDFFSGRNASGWTRNGGRSAGHAKRRKQFNQHLTIKVLVCTPSSGKFWCLALGFGLHIRFIHHGQEHGQRNIVNARDHESLGGLCLTFAFGILPFHQPGCLFAPCLQEGLFHRPRALKGH